MKLYHALAFPHLVSHVVIWDSAQSCHFKISTVHQKNMLSVMFGVLWVDGKPDVSTQDMYKLCGVMNVKSKLNPSKTGSSMYVL